MPVLDDINLVTHIRIILKCTSCHSCPFLYSKRKVFLENACNMGLENFWPDLIQSKGNHSEHQFLCSNASSVFHIFLKSLKVEVLWITKEVLKDETIKCLAASLMNLLKQSLFLFLLDVYYFVHLWCCIAVTSCMQAVNVFNIVISFYRNTHLTKLFILVIKYFHLMWWRWWRLC